MSLRRNAKGLSGLKTPIIFTICFIAVSVLRIILTTGSPSPSITSIGGSPPPSAMEITSAYAYQDPNNSSQASAFVIVVQPADAGGDDFACGDISISLVTPIASYENVYNISDFVNASTFNNIYDANLTLYQAVAPSCSIIELNGNGSQILEPGETFAVFLNLNSSCLNCSLCANVQFTIQITPSPGARLDCTCNIPANITPVMVLSGS